MCVLIAANQVMAETGLIIKKPNQCQQSGLGEVAGVSLFLQWHIIKIKGVPDVLEKEEKSGNS
jgi:hypothetical protein